MGVIQSVNKEVLKSYPIKLIELDVTGNYSKGTYYGDPVYTGAFNVGECTLFLKNLHEGGGSSSITFTVYIESYDFITEQWYDAVVFDTITVSAGATKTDEVQHKVATAGIGYYQRGKYIFGGNGVVDSPKFKLGVLYKL